MKQPRFQSSLLLRRGPDHQLPAGDGGRAQPTSGAEARCGLLDAFSDAPFARTPNEPAAGRPEGFFGAIPRRRRPGRRYSPQRRCPPRRRRLTTSTAHGHARTPLSASRETRPAPRPATPSRCDPFPPCVGGCRVRAGPLSTCSPRRGVQIAQHAHERHLPIRSEANSRGRPPTPSRSDRRDRSETDQPGAAAITAHCRHSPNAALRSAISQGQNTGAERHRSRSLSKAPPRLRARRFARIDSQSSRPPGQTRRRGRPRRRRGCATTSRDRPRKRRGSRWSCEGFVVRSARDHRGRGSPRSKSRAALVPPTSPLAHVTVAFPTRGGPAPLGGFGPPGQRMVV